MVSLTKLSTESRLSSTALSIRARRSASSECNRFTCCLSSSRSSSFSFLRRRLAYALLFSASPLRRLRPSGWKGAGGTRGRDSGRASAPAHALPSSTVLGVVALSRKALPAAAPAAAAVAVGDNDADAAAAAADEDDVTAAVSADDADDAEAASWPVVVEGSPVAAFSCSTAMTCSWVGAVVDERRLFCAPSMP